MKNLVLLFFTAMAPLSALSAQKFENFSHKSEAAIVSAGGNSRMETYNGKMENRYDLGKRIYVVSGHYTLGLSDQGAEGGDMVESARNWDAKFKYEQELSKKINAFAALQFEGDEFSGYEQRENHDIGAKRIFLDNDKKRFYLEAGYRYTEEVRVEADDNGQDTFYFHKGTLTLEYARKPGRNFTYSFWIQYVPNFTEPKDYLINFEPSFSLMINEIFSMKLGYKANYDNQPNIEGNKYLDYQYTTSLVAEF
ncbi:MAG: DUF481 domain-containing protein [Bacteriovoracaceae bacterium]